MNEEIEQIMNKFNENKKAFTLAEVLITLGIVGIIAAMTIPTVILNNEKLKTVVALKKAYSTFNQAMIQMADDYGCTGDLICTELVKNDHGLVFGEAISQYFKIVQNCGMDDTQICFASSYANNFDGSGPVTSGNTGAYRFIDADGMAFRFFTDYSLDFGAQNMSKTFGSLQVDVNGPAKGPNVQGKDIFTFWLTNGKGPSLYPQGGIYDDASPAVTSCTVANAAGYSCAARIMENSWQIDYY